MGKYGRFLLVGGVSTAVHYAVLVLLVEIGMIDPVPASSVAYIAGAVINYGLNRQWTFGISRSPHTQTIPRFILMVLLGFCLNYALMYLQTTILAIHYLLAQVVATLIVVTCNYLMAKNWVFKDV